MGSPVGVGLTRVVERLAVGGFVANALGERFQFASVRRTLPT